MNQNKTPLFTAMKNYVADKAVAFHTPGHKQGRGIPQQMREIVTDEGLKMEVSLMEELDDIHGATGCIKEAQDLAADLYGADESRFFINGTTGAVHAMMLTALNPGDKVIIPRNAHRCVVGGLALTGAEPVFIQPEIDNVFGIAMSITPQEVEKAVNENADAKALLMVYPTYYGVAGDIEKIAKIVHKRGMLLLVDEAHGPHFAFSDKLPKQALDCGADLTAQSTHKILGSMTQTSLLHLKSASVSKKRFDRMCSLVQSTSPNYLLLASLDTARWQMAAYGSESVDRAVLLARSLRNDINKIDGLHSFGAEYMTTPGRFALDETKITVSVRGLGVSGAEAEKILRHKYKVQCELSDFYNLLFIISYADTKAECAYLLKALRSLAADFKAMNNGTDILSKQIKMPNLPERVFSPREAVFKKTRPVKFSKSEGLTSGEIITFYPPGIPVIYPGERISREIIEYVTLQMKNGGNVVGPEDKTLRTIEVVEE